MPSLDENLLPRREEESGSRRILAISVAVLGLAVLVGGLWIAYSAGVKNSAGGAVPLVRAPDTPAKTTPADPGGMQVANQNAEVFGTIQRGGQRPLPSRTESILPPPEQPLPQAPEPPAAAVAAAPPAPATVTIPAPGVPQPHATVPAPATTPDTPKTAPQVAAQPAPPPPIPTPAPPPPPAALPAGSVRIQVGAHRDRPTAEQEWARLSRRFPEILGDLSPIYERADLGQRGVFIRIQTGVRDQATAETACARLKAEKQVCAIVGR